MSKQSEAKKKQNYRKNSDTCSNCGHYASDKIKHEASFSWSKPFVREINKRCTIGGFAVQSMATCDRHVLKESGNEQ